MTKISDRYDPGPSVAWLGGINLGTTDIEKSLWFFRDTLGMEEVEREGDVAYLRCYQELTHHSLVLTQQDEAKVNSYSLRTRRPQDVELYFEELQKQGIEVLEVPAGTEHGRGTAVRFLLPGGGHPFELYFEIDKPSAREGLRSKLPSNSSRRRGLGVRRIDHYNLQTSPDTINVAEQWMRDTLGFNRREFGYMRSRPDTLQASWMSVTPQVHDVAIVANGDNLSARMHHVAFNLENYSDQLTAADVLSDLEVEIGVGPGKHGIGQAMYLYVFDPGSGHRVELYSGGYLIFDPDWAPLEWDPDKFPMGMTWYGDPIDLRVGSRGRDTTPSAGLRLP